jgi:porphobilinogen synthase
MDPANVAEALREETDLDEGADISVKPALHYLDVISRVKMQFDSRPRYHERRIRHAQARRGARMDDERRAISKPSAIKRAGADIIITYYARDAARIL